MEIDYDPTKNSHTLQGAQAAFRVLFGKWKLASLLDVGCGPGAWLKAAIDQGVTNVVGVDGLAVSENELFVPSKFVKQVDLTHPWSLARRFDVALCLEVAEHLQEQFADVLVASLTAHADVVVFSAACPGQPGQHHVNCQWPAYWQSIFNSCGFACSDAIRWQIWNESAIEPWYRQNVFIARHDPGAAGKEDRIRAVVHPEMLRSVARLDVVQRIERGSMPVTWYFGLPVKAFVAKAVRLISRARPVAEGVAANSSQPGRKQA